VRSEEEGLSFVVVFWMKPIDEEVFIDEELTTISGRF